MGRKAEILLHLFLVLNEIIMKLMKYVMMYAPFGIVFLVIGKILEIDDVTKTAQKLGNLITIYDTHLFSNYKNVVFVYLIEG